MFKQRPSRTRIIYALAIVTLFAAACLATAPSPKSNVPTRAPHSLDALDVQNVGTEENPVLVIIAISDTGSVDMEIVPQPVRVVVTQ